MNELLGDELLGDDLLGDDLLGDELLGDELVGDDLLGDEIMGDDLVAGDDLLGDEIMGDDLVAGDEILGSWRRQMRQKKQGRLGQMRTLQRAQNAQNLKTAKKNLVRRAILAKKIQNAKILEPRRPTHSRVQSMGLSLASVAPGATVDIIARPQEIFRGRRLVVPSTIAGSFMIEDIKVGRTSQFVSSGRQPALVFSELSTGDNLSLKTCSPGMDIVLKVTNVSDDEVNFDSSLIGDVVE